MRLRARHYIGLHITGGIPGKCFVRYLASSKGSRVEKERDVRETMEILYIYIGPYPRVVWICSKWRVEYVVS